MRIVVHGQQAFGKAVLEKFLERGENVVAVFCAPDKEGRPRDALATFAEEKGLPLHQPTSWKTQEAFDLMKSYEPDVCAMAYVTLFVPQPVVDLPKLGTYQYHPSLLPLHRGPSSINWPIIMGSTQTGLTIFEPDEGLDEGPVILQKFVDIGPDDTLGSIYFNKLFPMGVDAMVEVLDMFKAGTVTKTAQDHSKATYESWCRKGDAEIDFSKPAAEVYNRIRGCDPQPGTWTTHEGVEIQVFDTRSGGAGSGAAPGTITGISEDGISVACSGGEVVLKRVRPKGGKKIAAHEWAAEAGLKPGDSLGN